jgi:hypothetical protein
MSAPPELLQGLYVLWRILWNWGSFSKWHMVGFSLLFVTTNFTKNMLIEAAKSGSGTE